MKTKLTCILCLVMCIFGLSACEKQGKTVSSSISDNTSVSSAAVSVPKTDNVVSEPITPDEVSISDARRTVSETIDTDTYMVLDAKSNLEIDSRSYYLFIIANKSDNKALGQIAVDKITGKKYNYTANNTLEDYSTFTLYDESVDMVANWDGVFSDGTNTLTLIAMDTHSFEYTLGDTVSVAQALGNTATDEYMGITFTYGTDGSITLSGAAEGVFYPA